MKAMEDEAIENMVARIEGEIGPIEVVIYNLGAQIGNPCLAETSDRAFEMGWRLATQGLFRLARSVSLNGSVWCWKPHRYLRYGSNARQSRATLTCRSHGRKTPAVPDIER